MTAASLLSAENYYLLSSLTNLKRAVAKDFGENLCRKVGDDGQQSRHASCGDIYVEKVEYAKSIIRLHNKLVGHEEQWQENTHDATSRLISMAILLVFTPWTLYNCVAPGIDHYAMVMMMIILR